MREKSRSVLTSFRSRRPFRCATSSDWLRGRYRARFEDVLQRAEHEGERGAELVAHVGEERGLRPVQLGQRLGPLALVVVRARVDDARGDVAGDQLAEAEVVVVQHPARADAEHGEARGAFMARAEERRDEGLAIGGSPQRDGGPPGRRRAKDSTMRDVLVCDTSPNSIRPPRSRGRWETRRCRRSTRRVAPSGPRRRAGR
jgi:hypothetical protein